MLHEKTIVKFGKIKLSRKTFTLMHAKIFSPTASRNVIDKVYFLIYFDKFRIKYIIINFEPKNASKFSMFFY